jgi:hypothetical protein
VQTAKDTGTPKTTATINRDASNAHVSSVVEIILPTTRDVRSTRNFKRKHIYTPPAQIKETLRIQPEVSYAQVTKQEFHAPTNIEQEPHIKQSHRQTSEMQELKNMMKILFEQIGTMVNLTTVIKRI